MHSLYAIGTCCHFYDIVLSITLSGKIISQSTTKFHELTQSWFIKNIGYNNIMSYIIAYHIVKDHLEKQFCIGR